MNAKKNTLTQDEFESKRAELVLLLNKACEEYDNAWHNLHNLELEQFAEVGENIYKIPYQYMVTGAVTVYAHTLDIAYDKVQDVRTPLGEYMDGSWESNPSDESEGNMSEEDMIIGVVK